MNPIRLIYGFCAILFFFATSASAQASAGGVAFTNVRILTMTDAGTIERGHAIVRNGRIVAVGAGEPDAGFTGTLIDGGGATLMPGLSDMHVHYFEDGLGSSYVANSITSVRDLTGSLGSARRDQAARSGVLVGPRVYSSGPIIDGGEGQSRGFFINVPNGEQAVGAVQAQARSGFDAVKLYSNLSEDSFRAAAAAARKFGLRVYCHVPDTMTVEQVLAIGVDSIEHFDGYSEALLPQGVAIDNETAWAERWAKSDRSRYRELAELTAEAGTWTVPTFAITYGRIYSADPDAYFARDEARYLPSWAASWRGAIDRYEASRPYFEAQIAAKQKFLMALHKAGAGVLIGTDSPNPFVTPGYAIHDELRAFVGAGFSNREVLEIATVEAARFLGEEGQFGVVAPGARGDLVLLQGDPLTDLDVLRDPLGVMVNGNWHDRTAIAAALERRAESMRAQ